MTLTIVLAAALAPLGLAYVVACVRDPLRYGLPVYAALIPFSSLIAIFPGPFGSLSSLSGLLLGVALLAQLLTNRRGSSRLLPEVPVWLAFLALCGLSVFWSIVPLTTVRSFGVLASLVLLFVLLVLTRFDATSLRRFETALVVGGVLVVCYGLAQLLFLGGFPTLDGRAARFGNDLLGANNQAQSLLLPIAIAAWRTLRLRAHRLLHAATTLLLLFGIVMTGSRGGLLAAALVLGVVLLVSGAPRRTVIGLAAAAAVLLGVVLVFRPAGVGARQLDQTGTSGRSDIWAVGAVACRDYCLTGTGWGGFPTAYEEELPKVGEAHVQERGTAFEPHNIFLLAGVESGVLGLVLVLIGLGLAVLSAVRLPAAMRGPPLAAILGTLVSSFFLSNLEFKFFWAVLAYVSISTAVAAAGSAQPVPRRLFPQPARAGAE